MTMNDASRSEVAFPFGTARKEQSVLITDNGEERTFYVTEEMIFKSIDEVEANTLVVLEKCVPVDIWPSVCVFAMTYNEDSPCLPSILM